MALNGHKAVHQLFHRAVLRVGGCINWAGLDDVDRDAARAKIPRQAARHYRDAVTAGDPAAAEPRARLRRWRWAGS